MPKKAGEKRPRQVNVRLTEKTYDTLTLVATLEGVDRADFVRRSIERSLDVRLSDESWREQFLEPHRRAIESLEQNR